MGSSSQLLGPAEAAQQWRCLVSWCRTNRAEGRTCPPSATWWWQVSKSLALRRQRLQARPRQVLDRCKQAAVAERTSTWPPGQGFCQLRSLGGCWLPVAWQRGPQMLAEANKGVRCGEAEAEAVTKAHWSGSELDNGAVCASRKVCVAPTSGTLRVGRPRGKVGGTSRGSLCWD